ERHHAGVGEEQGGITGRNQRRARHDLMAPFSEETQEAVANLFTSHRLCFLLRVPGVVCCAAQQTLDYVLRITAAQQQPERPSAGLRLFSASAAKRLARSRCADCQSGSFPAAANVCSTVSGDSTFCPIL